ncbi:hypothetical protein ACN08P_11155 [Photobacterium leiognathi subsp. mandapamensis]|uniref:phage major tropism determinant n=1 Tax=Photobacterium leiognathi TaxID=553611 RepID=UPI003AF35CDE
MSLQQQVERLAKASTTQTEASMLLAQKIEELLNGGGAGMSGDFSKTITSEPAFMIAGGELKTACAFSVVVGGKLVTHGANEVITVPTTMIIGTDYAIYATQDGLVVSSNFTQPDGYTADNSRRIGGFHYGNNEYKEFSIYDLKFRPKCRDPRGMVIAPSKSTFWADIYLMNTTPDLLGTSAYNAQIADGDSCPKKPAVWGGNGTEQYSTFSQYIATEVLAAYGKRLPNQHEFSVLAQGSKTGHASSGDPVKTKFDVNARSMIGCEQVSGHMWQWGSENWDRGNGVSGNGWNNVDTDNKGQVHAMTGTAGVGASRFGAHWGQSGVSGSRSSGWDDEPWHSHASIAARGVCDHLEQM